MKKLIYCLIFAITNIDSFSQIPSLIGNLQYGYTSISNPTAVNGKGEWFATKSAGDK
jgi:hypothetical protein